MTLDETRPYKPLDFGAGGITGSVDRFGRIIALNTFHPEHGYITLTAAEPFPESERYNPEAVRAYRRNMAALDGFGWTLAQRTEYALAGFFDGYATQTKTGGGAGDLTETITFVTADGVVQPYVAWTDCHWRGRLSLQRCAYSQLTEGGPLAPLPLELHARLHEGILTITNPALGVSACIAGLPKSETWEIVSRAPIEVDLTWIKEQYDTLVIAYAFGQSASEAAEKALRLRAGFQMRPEAPGWAAALQTVPDPLVQRGLRYGMMVAIPVGEGVCILTDHMLLPLSWNRDAYYVARALLSWRNEEAVDVVRRHLLWMFEQAERPDGFWGRCYLANGRIKDSAFQLDQQLFPLLQLAEYTLETGDTDTLNRLQHHIAPLIERLKRLQAEATALSPTDETPADDPIALPYHLSSHILFWRTLMMLERAGIEGNWRALAETIHGAVQRYFVTDFQGKQIYAYATDGKGNYHFYHDANDFPLVLAPAWGFTTANDSVWQATIEFAWSEANEGGCYQGRLGSVHTRAAWPLGDVQEMIVARAMGDEQRLAKARAHLEKAAQWDGALPEATDPETGAVISRHWFAWPNAALACVELGAFD